MFLSECRVFPSALCFACKKKLMTTRFSMLLKSNASLTCFRACFLPGRAKDLSVPRYQPKKSPFVKEKKVVLTSLQNLATGRSFIPATCRPNVRILIFQRTFSVLHFPVLFSPKRAFSS